MRDVTVTVGAGRTFKAYNVTVHHSPTTDLPDSSTGALVPLDPPGPVLHFFSARQISPGTTITAKFKLPTGDTEWTLTKSIAFDAPTFNVSDAKVGHIAVNRVTRQESDGNGGQVSRQYDEVKIASLTDQVIDADGHPLAALHGFQIAANVTFPAMYGELNTGLWHFCQLVVTGSYLTQSDNKILHETDHYRDLGDPDLKYGGLDGNVPLPKEFNCSVGKRFFLDSPGFVLPVDVVEDPSNPIAHATIDDTLHTYVMFQPPPNGAEAYLVPLSLQPWHAFGYATHTSAGWTVGGSSSSLGTRADWPSHPVWPYLHPFNPTLGIFPAP